MEDPQRQVQVLADIARWHGARRPDAPAVVFGSRTVSFSELDRRSNQVAHGLLAAGITPGARVGVLGKDSDLGVEVLFGCAKANGVLLGVNWRLAAPEVRFILEHARAEILFVDPDQHGRISEVLPALPDLRHVVLLDDASFSKWRDGHPTTDPDLAHDPDAVAAQMYTSGTTGNPKGVMLANRSFFAIVRGMKDIGDPWIGWTGDDVSLLSFPLFHIGGLWWAMTSLCAGARLIVVPAFVACESLRLIDRHRVTKACMVPAMIQMMLAEPDCETTDAGSLTHIIYGGSPITRTCLESAIATFGCAFGQIYGLTETGNTAVFLWPDDHRREHLLRAAGRPYPNVRAKVIDEAGLEVPAGTVGEICLHSPANMVGYFENDEATATTFIDGWVHTGDAGFIDDEGYVFVNDRLKDMIISAGENIYPAEIESVVASHPALLECAVIGIPDDRWGELVKAVVVLRVGHTVKTKALIAHCRAQLADFKVPRSVDVIDALPRTPSGKVQKHILRGPYWEGHDRQVN